MDIRPWQLSYSELDIIKPIGEGSSARVYVARWHQTIVAVKVFQTRGQQGQEVLKEGGGGGANGAGGEGGAPAQGLTLSSPLLDSLRKEAGFLASLRHPNILGTAWVVGVKPAHSMHSWVGTPGTMCSVIRLHSHDSCGRGRGVVFS